MNSAAALWLSVSMLAGVQTSQPSEFADQLCTALTNSVRSPSKQGAAVFVQSYEPGPQEQVLPAALGTTAFVYDNALAVIALVACGNVDDALRIGRAFDVAIHEDRTFRDGRIRNAYRSGLVDEGPPALPGWWDDQLKLWAEDAAQDGTSTGNVAWAGLALLTLHQVTGDRRFLLDASRLLGWITEQTSSADGFTGGLHGFDPKQTPLLWKSTEHNVDVYALATWLYRLQRDPAELAAASRASLFVTSAFHAEDNHFDLGTRPNGDRNDGPLTALDVQLWPWMAMPDGPRAWRQALNYAEKHFSVPGGFDFNNDRDGLWTEGTAQAALAYRIAGDRKESDRLIDGLQKQRSESGLLFATGIGKVSTGLSVDPTKTGADFFYYHRPHIGATAWAVLAAKGWNPFLGQKVD